MRTHRYNVRQVPRAVVRRGKVEIFQREEGEGGIKQNPPKKKQVEWKPPGGWRTEKKIGEGAAAVAELLQHQQRATLPVSSRFFFLFSDGLLHVPNIIFIFLPFH